MLWSLHDSWARRPSVAELQPSVAVVPQTPQVLIWGLIKGRQHEGAALTERWGIPYLTEYFTGYLVTPTSFLTLLCLKVRDPTLRCHRLTLHDDAKQFKIQDGWRKERMKWGHRPHKLDSGHFKCPQWNHLRETVLKIFLTTNRHGMALYLHFHHPCLDVCEALDWPLFIQLFFTECLIFFLLKLFINQPVNQCLWGDRVKSMTWWFYFLFFLDLFLTFRLSIWPLERLMQDLMFSKKHGQEMQRNPFLFVKLYKQMHTMSQKRKHIATPSGWTLSSAAC